MGRKKAFLKFKQLQGFFSAETYCDLHPKMKDMNAVENSSLMDSQSQKFRSVEMRHSPVSQLRHGSNPGTLSDMR